MGRVLRKKKFHVHEPYRRPVGKISKKTAGARRRKVRESLIKKYGRCIITGWSNPVEYQTSHIVPHALGTEIGFKDVDTTNNCMLLANGLHALFDQFQWTVDIYSFLDFGIQSDTHCTVTLLMKKEPAPGTSCLADYVRKELTIPVCYLPSLYVHYNVYLHHNYTSAPDYKALFEYYLNTEDYKNLSQLRTTTEFYDYLTNKRAQEDVPSVVVDNRRMNYRIMWQYWSASHASWEPDENIGAGLKEEYHDYLEYLNDPTYNPHTDG